MESRATAMGCASLRQYVFAGIKTAPDQGGVNVRRRPFDHAVLCGCKACIDDAAPFTAQDSNPNNYRKLSL
jgi:hypothetical protein